MNYLTSQTQESRSTVLRSKSTSSGIGSEEGLRFRDKDDGDRLSREHSRTREKSDFEGRSSRREERKRERSLSPSYRESRVSTFKTSASLKKPEKEVVVVPAHTSETTTLQHQQRKGPTAIVVEDDGSNQPRRTPEILIKLEDEGENIPARRYHKPAESRFLETGDELVEQQSGVVVPPLKRNFLNERTSTLFQPPPLGGGKLSISRQAYQKEEEEQQQQQEEEEEGEEEQKRGEGPERRAAKSSPSLNIKLGTLEEIQRSWRAVSNSDPHTQFLVLGRALIDIIEKSYRNGGVFLEEKVISKENGDTVAFLDYLRERRESRFHVTSIDNKKLASVVMKKDLPVLALIRTLLAKLQICESLKEILLIPCSLKRFKNYIRLFPKNPNPQTVKYLNEIYKLVPQQAPFSNNYGVELMGMLRKNLSRVEAVNRPFAEKWYANGFTKERDLFHFPLVHNFMVPEPTEGDDLGGRPLTFFHQCALKGALFMGEGQIETRQVMEERTHIDERTFTGISIDGLRFCTDGLSDRNLTITQHVSVRVFLNSSKASVSKANLFVNKNPGSINLAVNHELVSRTRPLSSPLPESLDALPTSPMFYMIERGNARNSINHRFNFDHFLSNRKNTSRDYFEYLLNSPQSLDLESNLFIQNQTEGDDISIYMEWYALEGPAELVVCLQLVNLLISQVKTSITEELKRLADRIRMGNSSIKEGLLVLFPTHDFQGIDLTKF